MREKAVCDEPSQNKELLHERGQECIFRENGVVIIWSRLPSWILASENWGKSVMYPSFVDQWECLLVRWYGDASNSSGGNKICETFVTRSPEPETEKQSVDAVPGKIHTSWSPRRCPKTPGRFRYTFHLSLRQALLELETRKHSCRN